MAPRPRPLDASGYSGDHDASPKLAVRAKDKRPTRPSHMNKGKQQRDRRKLREKRRSTGVVHMPSTEVSSTGGSTNEEDDDQALAQGMCAETRRNTQHNEFTDPAGGMVGVDPSARPLQKPFRNKSPSDLDADDEDNQAGGSQGWVGPGGQALRSCAPTTALSHQLMELPASVDMMPTGMNIIVKEEWERQSPASMNGSQQDNCPDVLSALGIKINQSSPLQLGMMAVINEPDCALLVHDSNLTPAQLQPAPEPCRCDLCGKVLSCAASLRRHQVTHSSARPHACDQCGRAFSTAAYLTTHRRTHSAARPHTCSICHKGFTRSTGLHRHMELHLEGSAPPRRRSQSPAQCAVCGKHFTRALSVKAHMRIHTGERPHKCELCDKAFKNSSHLKVHSRTHSKERRHTCDLCGKGFAESSSLRRHMLVHTGARPYECDICGKEMRYLSHLKAHRRKHTGETPYQCNICGQLFRLYQTYRLHVRKHNGQLPTCTACGKAFSNRARLEEHSQMHSGLAQPAAVQCAVDSGAQVHAGDL
ncbi:zinc finger protein 558-like [Pollicipes pollicipes]|uniref:zinc finger protein 558-like n=1 Tax=Pollicipes pollicipes TaxID=41117 RepID=UPI001885631A|nr:zinc finger protein 558-like [Pollicipes pollicipes]